MKRRDENAAQARTLHDSSLACGRRDVLGEECEQPKDLAGPARPFPHPYTINDANEFLQRALSAHPATSFCIDIDGAAVGGIGIRLGEDVHRYRAELGYWLSEDFWGHGITSEVVPVFTEYCFANFHLHRIYAEPYANNPASARVLEKSGFVLEGRLRKNVVKDREVLDSLLYAKTK